MCTYIIYSVIDSVLCVNPVDLAENPIPVSAILRSECTAVTKLHSMYVFNVIQLGGTQHVGTAHELHSGTPNSL